jgi:hypothetical protein
MLIDHERVLLDLKRSIAAKSHHGQRDLLAEIARLEVENVVEEGVPERALRLYGVALSSDLIRPSSLEPRVALADGHNGDALRPGSHRDKEERHERHRIAAGVT